MKKYYQTLSKEKKKEIKEIYQKEYKNTDLQVRLGRLIIYAVIGYITSLFIYISAFIEKDFKVENIIIGTILLVASTIFLIGRTMIKQNVLNKLALKEKNEK